MLSERQARRQVRLDWTGVCEGKGQALCGRASFLVACGWSHSRRERARHRDLIAQP